MLLPWNHVRNQNEGMKEVKINELGAQAGLHIQSKCLMLSPATLTPFLKSLGYSRTEGNKRHLLQNCFLVKGQ